MNNTYFVTLTKKEFSEKLKISDTTRRKYLNQIYYEDLKKIGYIKTQKLLFPIQVEFLYRKLCYITES